LSLPAESVPVIETSTQVLTVQENTKIKPLTTKGIVLEYFSDIPIMVDVARCESHFRHTEKDGSIKRGVANRHDVGVMQINELYHLKKAERLGIDIYSLEGNLAFARYLYEKEGARPWLASSHCWANYREIALN